MKKEGKVIPFPTDRAKKPQLGIPKGELVYAKEVIEGNEYDRFLKEHAELRAVARFVQRHNEGLYQSIEDFFAAVQEVNLGDVSFNTARTYARLSSPALQEGEEVRRLKSTFDVLISLIGDWNAADYASVQILPDPEYSIVMDVRYRQCLDGFRSHDDKFSWVHEAIQHLPTDKVSIRRIITLDYDTKELA